MQTFKKLFKAKTGCQEFKALYQKECHVCIHTLRIFEQVDIRKIALEHLADAVQVDIAALQALKDAEYCDPSLVAALCQYLDLEKPGSCPRQTLSSALPKM
jgi:hypothetical protein